MFRPKLYLLLLLFSFRCIQAQDELSPIATMQHAAAVNQAVFDAKDKYIGTASADRTAGIWDPNNISNVSGVFIPNKIATLRHQRDVNQISIADKYAATVSDDNTGRVWKLETRLINALGQPSLEFVALLKNRDGSDLKSVRFSPSEEMIITGSTFNLATLFDLNDISVRSNHDANYGMYQDDYEYFVGSNDGATPFTDIPEPDVLARLWHIESVVDIAFSTSDTWIATLAEDRVVKIWDYSKLIRTNMGRVMPTLVTLLHLEGEVSLLINELLLINGGDHLVVSHGDQANVFDLRDMSQNVNGIPTPKLIAVAQTDDSERVRSIHVCPNSRKLAMGSEGFEGSEGTATVWNLAEVTITSEGVPIPQLISKQRPGGVNHIMLDNSCNFVAMALLGDNEAHLYDLKNLNVSDDNAPTPELLVTMPHNGEIRSLKISGNNQWILTASEDNSARLWDISPYTGSSASASAISMPILLFLWSLSQFP